MQPKNLEKRVEILEQTMAGLHELPARVEALEGQVLQLRIEMHGEFSAVREEIRSGDEETRTYMRILHEAAMSRIGAVAEGHGVLSTRYEDLSTGQQILVRHHESLAQGQEALGRRYETLAQGQEETRRQLGALHEHSVAFRDDVTTRLTAIGAQLTRRRRTKNS